MRDIRKLNEDLRLDYLFPILILKINKPHHVCKYAFLRNKAYIYVQLQLQRAVRSHLQRSGCARPAKFRGAGGRPYSLSLINRP